MTSAATHSIKLTYFDFGGRAEPIRLALALSKIPFEDHRISRADWLALKPNTPYGQVPLLTVDGDEPKAQSMAILRYVGATFSETLYPRERLYEIEEALGVLDDFWTSWSPCYFMAMSPQIYGYPEGFGKTEEGQECIKQMRINWLETKLPELAKNIEHLIEKNGGLWIGSKEEPTIADCVAYFQLDSFTLGHMDHIPTDCLDKYTSLKAYHDRFKNLPEIKEWYAAAKK
ncbi:hypothetical protein MPSEU_001087200 [Mayamaea pseudoterrestris]|nr:hypothetical protein MPSEU_001087200 [Mayamaea pseudoterrestris]